MADNAANGVGDPVDKRLDELRRQQQESERKAKRETERAQKYKTELEALVKAKTDLDQALDDYRGKLGDLEDKRKELWRFRDQRYEANRRAVGEQQARQLDGRFRDYNAALVRDQEELGRMRTELWDTQSELENAARELAAAQRDFAGLIGRPKTISDNFALLEVLKSRLDEADDKALHALKYVLILEFDLVLRNAGRDPGEDCRYWGPGDDDERSAFYSPGTYRSRLVAAWDKLTAKQQALRDAQEKDADLQEKIDRLDAERETRRKNRVDRVAPPEADDDGGDGAEDGCADDRGREPAAVA